MKKLAGLVVILAALILGGYYGTGIITERTLKKNIAMIDQSNGVYVEIEQYHRGFYRSTALLNWRMQVPARTIKNQEGEVVTLPAQEYKMQVPLDIYHGPIMFVNSKPMFGLGYARSLVTLPQPYAAQFATVYTDASTAPVLNLSIFVNYLNNSTLNLGIPTFKLISKEGSKQFEWLGMTSETRITSNNNKVKGRVTIDGINFQKDKVSMALAKVSSDYDLHRTNLDLYLGDANVLLPSLVVMQDDKKMLDVQQLDVHSNSDIHDGLFDSRLKLSLAKLLSDDKVYGPVLFDVSLNNLDADVLAKINRQINELQKGSDADPQKTLLMLMPELPKLLGKGARLEVSELSLTMPEGIIKGNLQVSLPAEGIDNPFQLIQKIQGQGKITFSDAVMKQLINDSAKQALQNQLAAPVADVSSIPAASETVAAPDSSPAAVLAPDAPAIITPDSASTATTATEAVVPAQVEVSSPKVVDQESISKLANEKLANMVQSGLLFPQGSDYVVEFKLADGKFEVNGKPFNPAMMSF